MVRKISTFGKLNDSMISLVAELSKKIEDLSMHTMCIVKVVDIVNKFEKLIHCVK